MAVRIFSRISLAAALVKVTTRILSISTGSSGSVIFLIIRSTSTVVFPEPAAAETKMSLSLKSITFCWPGVKLLNICFSFFGHFQFSFHPFKDLGLFAQR